MGVATESGTSSAFKERMRDLYRATNPDGTPGHETKLTSLGYGDPTFSSFYPNAREILGHYVDKEELDSDGAQEASKWLVYAKLYDPDDETTPLAELMADTGLSLESLLSQLGWLEDTTGLKCVYLVGAVELERGSAQHDPVSDSSLEFAIGNTGTEALSAHLGNRLAAEYGDAGKIEEQLEAILMGNKVHGHAADLSLKFLEARHAQGYQKHPGGMRWRLTGKQQESAALHDSLATTNRCQEEVERTQHELNSAKRELFGDWYKYMLAKYPAISEFPKGRKYLISLSFRGKSSVRPVQVGGSDVNIVPTAVRGRSGPVRHHAWLPALGAILSPTDGPRGS